MNCVVDKYIKSKNGGNVMAAENTMIMITTTSRYSLDLSKG